MENTQNWDILLELFAALRIPAFCLSAEELSKNRIRFDFGLRGLFLPAFAYPSFFAALLTECQPGTLSRYCDRFQLHYFLLGLPESPQNGANVPESAAGAARWVWVGPYATAPCTPETLIERAGFYPSAPIQAPLEVFCQTIPLVAQEDFLFAAMEALANRVFGGPDCYLDRTLTLDGYLRGKMTWQLVGDRTVEIGSNLPYAAVHQFGATIKPRAAKVLMFRGHVAKSVTIPARPYLGLSDEDRSEIVGRTLEWLQRIMK